VSAAGLLAAAALGFAASASAAPAGASYGILLLAHGGDPSWNAAVEKLRVEVDSSVATELALGMADPITLQAGVDALQRRGVSRIVAVPLFVDSRSEVLDQTRYALGLTDDPSDVMRAAVERLKASGHMGAGAGHHHMMIFSLDRVKLKVPIALAAALDDDPFVSRVLLERAKALSRDPKKETVFLVAHGPVDGAAVGVWQNHLSAHSESVRREGGFRDAFFAVLRDDAAPDVRAAAVAGLRARVAAARNDGGSAIVVPVLIARGGIEDKIPRDLAGLTFAWSGDALLPHAGFADWVLRRAQSAPAPAR